MSVRVGMSVVFVVAAIAAFAAAQVGGRDAAPAPNAGIPLAPVTPAPADRDSDRDADRTAASTDGADGAVAALALPPAYDGSFEDGLATLRALAAAREPAEARAFADRLLAPRGVGRARLALWNQGGDGTRAALDATAPLTELLGWNGRPAVLRARVRLERGLASLDPEQRPEAERDFGRALALAPAGPVRLAAAYDLALVALLDAEDQRAEIPEFGGPDPNAAPAIPGVTSTPAAPQGAEDEPDPLEEARRAYEEALERFVDRLRLDWRDADTRANVEWCQRRLDELDELERQREEQEQEQQQQDQQDQQQDQQDGEQQDRQDQQDQEEQQQDESSDQQDESSSEDEREGEEESEPEGEDEPREEDAEDQDAEQDAPQDAEPREVHLSEEEMQRLLNRLAEHEREAERLREMRRQRGSNQVDRDW